MSEKKNKLILISLFTAVSFWGIAPTTLKAAKMKDELKKVYRPRINDTEFIVPAKTGFIRNYHRLSSDALIDFISLSEEDKAQCAISGIRWKYNWQGLSSKILDGKISYSDTSAKDPKWYSPNYLKGNPLTIFGADGKASLESTGKLYNEWTQTLSWSENDQKNETIKTLNINWKRKLDEIGAIGITIQFPKTLPPEAYITVDGACKKLEDSQKETLKKGEKVSISCPVQASLLNVSFDVPGKIELAGLKSLSGLIGGWRLKFIPEDGESLEKISMTLEDHAYKKLKCNGLEIAPNISTGTYSTFIGGMPLFQIYGTEGKAVQGLEGKWETKVLGKETNHYIKSSGKIINDSKTTCRINKENAVFKFQQENPGKESGIVFRIPYAWIGSRYLIRRFSEKADMAGITPPYASNEFLKNLTYEDSFKGCPLKIGACLDLDVIPANSRLEWFPTESEKITFIFKQNCRVAAGRFQKFLYNPPFDISTLPDWSKMISSAKKQGPIEFAPPAFFKVYPTEKGTEAIAVECFYEKVWDKKKKLTKENKTSEKTDDIACVKEGANVIIKTPYWQVTHDGTKGGVPSKIIFPQGLNENILKAPIASYIVDKTDKNFAESDFENPEIKIDKSKKGVIKLVVTGKLGNSGVPFTTEYIYDKGGLRRNLTLGFDKKPMEIKTLGVARIETTPSLDYAKYKPCLTRYTKAVFPGPPVTQGTRLYLGVMGLYRQNGEGIDFTPASDIWKWYVLGENKGFFAIKGNNANPMIVAEALHVNKSIKVDKEISYEHYIGLPEAKDPAPRKWRPCGISECRWVTTNDNVVKTFADSGINVAISPGGSVGFGCYYKQLPPIFLETAAKLKKNGISPLPFFAPTCFVKKCKEVNENKDKWAMGSYKDGKFQPSWCGTYLMGCYESKGLVDFMKKGYANVMKYYPNNGIYCDFIYPMGPCKNPAHAKTPHIAMDGLLEFCDWLRYDLLKKDQIFYAHTGYCPVYNVERYCDLAFTWEEMNYWYSNENRPVSLERVSECGVQTSNIQRAMDPHPIFSWQKRNGEPLGMTRIRNLPEDTRAVITRMALNGVFPILHTGMISPVSEKDLLDKSKDFLKLYKAFKEVELSEYHFMDWKKQNVALTESPYIRMAVYFKDKSALIIIGVPESVKKQKFNWKISEAFLKELGLTGNLTIKNSTTGESAQSTATQLSRKGIDAELEGFDFAVMELKKN